MDFRKIKESDENTDSKFQVAGRMYYEAHAFGYRLTSFTASGFLDVLGYEVAPLRSSRYQKIIDNWVEYAFGVAVALFFINRFLGGKRRSGWEENRKIK